MSHFHMCIFRILYFAIFIIRPDDVLNNWAITLGEHSQQLNENFSANYRISRIIIHEDYRRETLKNDIAVYICI